MEETAATASENTIRHSDSLCAGEQKYASDRKKNILETIQKLGLDCTERSVPHIALLGSGGGERATVAMLGSIHQLVKEGLYDTFLYTGGVSGSTWAMASLYSDQHFEAQVDQIISKMQGPVVPLDQIVGWLDGRTEEETFSLTDIWAVLISAAIMKQLEQRHLSEESNAINPYPIYSAVEREFTSDKPENGHWFELGPHESGFTDLNLFIETSLLGSKFGAGELLKKSPEMDMVKLQGICGSALSDWETIIHPLFCPGEAGLKDTSTQEHRRVFMALDDIINMIKLAIKDPDVLAVLENLQQKLKEIIEHGNFELLERNCLEERKHVSQEQIKLLLQELDLCCEHLSTNHGICHLLWRLLTLLPALLLNWEWGNTKNFLYSYQDANIPPHLCSKEIFYLIDAGLWMNLPYPPFLGKKRDIDLIIALDFSAGEIFKTLTLAKKYALDTDKPFPEIDDHTLEEKDWPKDCYVFKGKNKEPTIIYMPLFNRSNCRDAKEIKAKMTEFHTFQFSYNSEKMNKLLNIARDNIKRNKTILQQEIEMAIQRRTLSCCGLK